MGSPINEQSETARKLTGFIVDVVKDASVVPVAFESLIDLGDKYVYNRMMVANGTDADIVLKFIKGLDPEKTSEITIPANEVLTFDNFRTLGEVEYKYVAVSAPTPELKLYVWFW